MLGDRASRWPIVLAILIVASSPSKASAGECLHLDDAWCDRCVAALLEDPAHWRSAAGDERFNVRDCDLSCDRACLFPKAVERLLGAEDKELADEILATLRPYRACWDETVPSLTKLLDAYTNSSPARRDAIRGVVRSLPPTNRGFRDSVGACVSFLVEREAASTGELRAALRIALGQVGAWEDAGWVTTLRADPQVRRFFLERVFNHPGPLERYLGPRDAQALRLLDTGSLRHLRNGIFARHGRAFSDPALHAHFESQDWYREDPDYSDALLERVDRHNLKLIRAEELRRR